MLDQIHTFVTTNLPASISVISIVLEFALRLTPTAKPLSIAQGAALALHKIADICGGIANFLDKVLPQNLTK